MFQPYDADWRRVRAQVLDRDRGLCRIRGPGCTVSASHVDHIVPLSEGGRRLDPDNLRASCEPCNLKRNRARQAELARFALQSSGESSPSREW